MELDPYAREYIRRLNLRPHPEGGFYRETYRSTSSLSRRDLPGDFRVDPPVSTAIYFLLTGDGFSALHRIKSDETWHFYDGDPLDVHMLSGPPPGRHEVLALGRGEGLHLQGTVMAGMWFGARVRAPGTWSLVGCTVAPGFCFEDFEMGSRVNLLGLFPAHQELVKNLTRLS